MDRAGSDCYGTKPKRSGYYGNERAGSDCYGTDWTGSELYGAIRMGHDIYGTQQWIHVYVGGN